MLRVLAAALAAALLLPAGAAGAQDADDPVAAAAGWLAGQLVDGAYAETEFDGDRFPDAGLTADVVLALAAAGRGGDHIEAAMGWLEGQVGSYVGQDGEAYAGAHAKLALTATVAGRDPASFGGRDLLADLAALETEEGRFSDQSEFGDFSTGISQALAILALQRAADGPSDAAVAYLVDVACEDGGVPIQLDEDGCVSDVDATAFAIQALTAAGQDGPAADATAWLVSQQQDDGGFPGSDGVVNANSTGLAAQALRVAGEADAADAAVGWLHARQQSCDDDVEVAGAVRYAPDEDGDLTRATAQAVPGMVGVGLMEIDAAGAQPDAPAVACEAGADDEAAAPDDEATTPDAADPTDDATATDEPAADAAGTGLPVWLLLVLLALFVAGVGLALARKKGRATS
jgi:hypothetical protein